MADGELYISVDVETAGPAPSSHALLSIGACLVETPDAGFYVELQPTTREAVPAALAVTGLSLEALAAHGTPPAAAMRQFAAWLDAVTPDGRRPVFVGYNAPFDWMFVADYFHRYLGRNPFGHAALDMKAFYLGLTGGTWGDTSLPQVMKHYGRLTPLTHNALQDARDQAALFARMLAEAAARAAPADDGDGPG